VKRSQSGLILDPVTLSVNSTVQDAENIMREFKIGGIPVVDGNGNCWELSRIEIYVFRKI